MQIILLIVIFGLMQAARSFSPLPGLGAGPAGTTLSAGFLLLAALLTGNLFKRIGLPRLTGYLSLGMVAGPEITGLVSEAMLGDLRIFNGVAIALIALTAGTEMDFRKLRPLLKGIAWISGVGVVGAIVLLAIAVLFLTPMLPFASEFTLLQRIALACVLGVTIAAQSPAVVVALRKETDADGPVSRTVLGVVVVSDLVVIILFALATGLTRGVLGSSGTEGSSAWLVAWEIFGSITLGVLIGVVIATYLRAVKSSGALFVVAVGFLVAEVGQRVHLDPLLIALAAGLLIRNFSSHGDRLHHEVEAASLPVYIAFFAVAGATIHLHALAQVGIPAVILAVVRAGGLLSGTRLATHFARSPEPVRRYAGFGLLPQAGLALALALLFARTFPHFGPEASALVFAIVGINEMVGPVIYKWALVKSGEAGKLAAPEEPESTVPGASLSRAPERA